MTFAEIRELERSSKMTHEQQQLLGAIEAQTLCLAELVETLSETTTFKKEVYVQRLRENLGSSRDDDENAFERSCDVVLLTLLHHLRRRFC